MYAISASQATRSSRRPVSQPVSSGTARRYTGQMAGSPDPVPSKPRVALTLADGRVRLTGGIVEPDELFGRMCDGVTKAHLPPTGGRLWTGAVKKTLRRFAREIDRGIDVYSSDRHDEFLLDVVWLKPARGDAGANGRILLAVESEWGGFDAVWYDFSKLLYVRAPRKVLISCLPPKTLKEAIRQFEQDIVDAGGMESHEKYIVINFGPQRVECWWCGPPSPVRFRKGPQREY